MTIHGSIYGMARQSYTFEIDTYDLERLESLKARIKTSVAQMIREAIGAYCTDWERRLVDIERAARSSKGKAKP